MFFVKMQIVHLYVEAILAVGVALALAAFVDWVVPMPKPGEKLGTTWGWLILQLFLDITIIFGMLYVFDRLGMLDQSASVGITVFILATTVFFIAQVQLASRLHRLYHVRSGHEVPLA